jgi:hypothetical protein
MNFHAMMKEYKTIDVQSKLEKTILTSLLKSF